MINDKIYTCGDSHCKFSFHDIEYVEPFHIGPVTMFRVGRDKIKFKELNIPSDGILLSSFGEIDVRCQIHKQINDNEDQLIEILVSTYINVLIDNRKEYSKLHVMNVVPPAYASIARNNPHFPFTGSDIERSRYCKKLNGCLKRYCDLNNFKIFDVYNEYIDENGMLIPELSDGGVHISNTDRVKALLETFVELTH